MDCICTKIFQGSTPSLYFNTNAPLYNVREIYMTFRQRGVIVLEKDKTAIGIVDKDTIRVKLAQEETLLLSSKYDIEPQLRIKYNDGSVVGSSIVPFKIEEVIKYEVI